MLPRVSAEIMDDSEDTRVVRLRADIAREFSENRTTRIVRAHPPSTRDGADHRSIFNHHQRRLHQMLREYPSPGVAIFALHPRHGIAGHMWLQASDSLRSGTVGRHNRVDLYLADDESLSLRHLLVLVKRRAQGLWFRIADLSTPLGFLNEQAEALRAVDSNGPLVLQAASFSLLVVPTGMPPPWDPDAADAWSTLPPRIRVNEKGRVLEGLRQGVRPRGRATAVTQLEGFAEAGPEPVLEPGEAIRGHLLLLQTGVEQRLAVGASALKRGIIIGRYSRCVGNTSSMTNLMSRVHAVVIEVDGQVHIVDAASTNGTFADGVEVKCAPVGRCVSYSLGSDTLLRWVT